MKELVMTMTRGELETLVIDCVTACLKRRTVAENPERPGKRAGRKQKKSILNYSTTNE